MRFVQIEILPQGKALVDIDKLTHAVPEGDGSRLFIGAQHLDVPHSLAELENVLAGRERTDDGANSTAGSVSGRPTRRPTLIRVSPVSPGREPGDRIDEAVRRVHAEPTS